MQNSLSASPAGNRDQDVDEVLFGLIELAEVGAPRGIANDANPRASDLFFH